MFIFYSLLLVMLLSAIGLLAFGFYTTRNQPTRVIPFCIIVFSFISIAISSYWFANDKSTLNAWLSGGKQHYQLLLKVDELGGIDAIITRMEKTLAAHPNDAKGWFILGKLYLSKQQYQAALDAFTKAHKLAPDDTDIKHYYEITIKSTPSRT